MNSSTKNILFALALPALIITQAAHGMELPGHELSLLIIKNEIPREIQAHILGHVTGKNVGWYETTHSKHTHQDTSETKRKYFADTKYSDKIDIEIYSSINNTDTYTTIASFDLSRKAVQSRGKTNYFDYCKKLAPYRSYHYFYANDTKIVLETISSNNTVDKFTYYQNRTIDQFLFKQMIKMGLTVKKPSKKITSIDSLLTEIASLFKGNVLALQAAWKRLPSEIQEDLWSNAQQFIQEYGKSGYTIL